MMFRVLLLAILFISQASVFAMSSRVHWQSAVDRAVHKYCLHREAHLEAMFKRARIHYPPNDITLLAFKQPQYIELWARDDDSEWRYIHTYPLTAHSGHIGPKLKEGDRQIPEGIYDFVSFNPFSTMHLSILLNYPNEFDRHYAKKDGRRKLGNEIFLHGKDTSVGCLAVGDSAIEELFLLMRRTGLSHGKVIIAPYDFRETPPPLYAVNQPKWLPELYQQIATALDYFA